MYGKVTRLKVGVLLLLALLWSVSFLIPSRVSAQTLSACIAPSSNSNIQQMQYATCYENKVGTAPIMMYFANFPISSKAAVTMGNQMAAILNTWHKTGSGVRPLIMMEPTLNNSLNLGSSLNMNLYSFTKGGSYYNNLTTFFKTIKNSPYKITDSEMGLWVPFPEPNQPQWYKGVTHAALFDKNVNNFQTVIKSQFPTVNTSIMLNWETQVGPSWTQVDPAEPYAALQPYLVGLKSAGLNSFGLQGFTWSTTDSAANFLSGSLAAQCANYLGLNHIWFNTGTYSELNDPNSIKPRLVSATDARRAQVLINQILPQVSTVQKDGLSVDFVNIFGQNTFNKSFKTGRGTANYSYATSTSLNNLKTFISDATALQTSVPVTIFNVGQTK